MVRSRTDVFDCHAPAPAADENENVNDNRGRCKEIA
jgi:hypothetical protein